MTPTKTRVYTGEGSPVDNYFKPTGSTPKNSQNQEQDNWGTFDNNNQQHRTIMALCRNRQWVKPNDKHPSGEVADMSGAFSSFLKSDRSPVKKPLMDMTPKEVSKIIVAMGGVVNHKFSK
jgi:hypothetical protein